jgi:hypothetical protein
VLRGADHLDAIGIAAAAGTAVCNTLGLLLTRRWARPDGVHHLTVTGWQMTAGGLLLLPAAVITEGAVPPFTPAAAATATSNRDQQCDKTRTRHVLAVERQTMLARAQPSPFERPRPATTGRGASFYPGIGAHRRPRRDSQPDHSHTVRSDA